MPSRGAARYNRAMPSRTSSGAPRTKTKTGAPLGQHFLTDRHIEQRIVAAVESGIAASQQATVLEIGAGPGNMTRLLAEKLASNAGRLISVEIDAQLAAARQAEFAGNERVEIIHDDILNVDVAALATRHGGKLVVFGNLPYYITSPILMKLFAAHRAIERIIVMMQYEVAERLTARPGEPEYGLLAVTAQFYSTPTIHFKIPPGAFNPPPKVMSALVALPIRSRADELGVDDEPSFWKWMRAAFAQKRKTLANNWKPLATPSAVATALTQLNLDARVRAEDLSLAQLAALYRSL
jgi:16S rRNA (adenine1518-N6/adenine1519-N6)-dimethyltransferase